MDRSERDKIREQYQGQTGVAAHVERLRNAEDNAEAQGQADRAAAARNQAAGLGYAREQDPKTDAERAGAERRAAAQKAGDIKPSGRTSPAARKQTAAGPVKPQQQAGDTGDA